MLMSFHSVTKFSMLSPLNVLMNRFTLEQRWDFLEMWVNEKKNIFSHEEHFLLGGYVKQNWESENPYAYVSIISDFCCIF